MQNSIKNRQYWLRTTSLVVLLSFFALLTATQFNSGKAVCSARNQVVALNAPDDPVRFSGDTMIVNTTTLGKDIQGFAGNVPVEVYILDGKVVKVTALANNETPGFFQQVVHILDSWKGLTPKQGISKNVDAVSGATYSSNAVVANVRAALEYADKADVKALRERSASQSSAQDVQSFGFKKINVMSMEDLPAGFSFFTGDNGHGLLLCSGDRQRCNAMTIGWGALGTLWGRRPAVTVYVAEKRYTREFMDKYEYFTIMHFPDNKVVDYMGTHSGRDGDKAQALGLHTLYTENGTPYYAEADLVIECRVMYGGEQFDPKHYRSGVPRKQYENFPAGIHYQYIGEVVNAWKK